MLEKPKLRGARRPGALLQRRSDCLRLLGGSRRRRFATHCVGTHSAGGCWFVTNCVGTHRA
eukprot:11158710-Lingulodinium_polyedra.AAC.1